MYHKIKHKIKSSKLIQYTLFLLLVVIIAAIPYPIPHNIKEKTIMQTEAMKSCLVTMGLPLTFQECASNLDFNEEQVTEGAEEILTYSTNDMQKMQAAIVLSKYSDAVLYFNNLTTPEQEDSRKDIVFALLSLREYGKAAEICETFSDDAFCLDALGIAYYALNRNNEAFEKGKQAYELNTDTCRKLNLGLYYGNTGNISEAKKIIDEVIRDDKPIVLKCWSPIKSDIPVSEIDRYNLCFLNNEKTKSICRAFSQEGWSESDVTKKETPEEKAERERQEQFLNELEAGRVL
ncbi:MAG: hypothetical protein KJ955_02725 [Nanoarchaeota archaeon]|nr:hypothetical protein [Nanoarchaeota archaeon]